MNVKIGPVIAAAACMLVSCGEPGPAVDRPTSQQVQAAESPASALPAGMFSEADNQEIAVVMAKVEEGEPVFVGLPNPPLASCALAEDEPLCRYEQLKLVRQWKAAFEGDYQSQRNVAFCLATTCEGMQPDRLQGCAWRKVIVASASPLVGEGDVMNADVDCGRLSEAGRQAAELQAARITKTITAHLG